MVYSLPLIYREGHAVGTTECHVCTTAPIPCIAAKHQIRQEHGAALMRSFQQLIIGLRVIVLVLWTAPQWSWQVTMHGSSEGRKRVRTTFAVRFVPTHLTCFMSF